MRTYHYASMQILVKCVKNPSEKEPESNSNNFPLTQPRSPDFAAVAAWLKAGHSQGPRAHFGCSSSPTALIISFQPWHPLISSLLKPSPSQASHPFNVQTYHGFSGIQILTMSETPNLQRKIFLFLFKISYLQAFKDNLKSQLWWKLHHSSLF